VALLKGLKQFGCLLVGLSLTACSGQVSPPELSNNTPLIEVEACKNADLSLSELTPQKVRGLIACLDGNHGALKAYRDLFESMSDEDLNILLTAYNQYLYRPAKRLPKALGVLSGLNKRGELQRFYRNLQVVINHQIIQSALPILARTLDGDGNLSTSADVDPQISVVNQYIVHLIDQNLLGPALVGTANGFDSGEAQFLAELLAKIPSGSLINSDKAIDVVADTVLDMINKDNYHAFLVGASDADCLNLPKVLDDRSTNNVADLLSYLPSGGAQGVSRIQRTSDLLVGANRDLTCFKGSGSRQIDNVLKFMMEEGSPRVGAGIDRYYLQTVPVLMAATRQSCNYDSRILDNLDVMNEAAQNGMLDGLHAGLQMILNSKRFDPMIAVATSEHLKQAAPVLEELGKRSAFGSFLNLARRNLSVNDNRAIAQGLVHFAVENIAGRELSKWIQANIKDPQIKSQILKELGNLPGSDQTMFNLDRLLMMRSDLSDAYRELKLAQVHFHFNGSFVTRSLGLLKKVLSQPDARGELKTLARNIAESLGDPRGGLGALTGVTAAAVSLSRENPVQDFARDVLKDEDLIRKLYPLFKKLSQDPKFVKAVDFTAELAGNGNLEKLVNFLIDTFDSSKGNALDSMQPSYQHAGPSGSVEDSRSRYRPYQPRPPDGDFSNCMLVKGDLSEPTGQTLYNVLKCANAQGGAPEMAALADHLKDAGLLDEAALFIKAVISGSPYIGATMDQLEQLWRSGDLDRLLKVFAFAVKPPYSLSDLLDPILASVLPQKGADDLLNLSGKVMAGKRLGESIAALLDVLHNDPKKRFQSKNDYRAHVQDPIAMKVAIAKLLPGWTAEQVNAAYEQAREEFESHNDDYYYRDGVIPKFTDEQYRDKLVSFVTELLRGDALEQLLMAMQDLAGHVGRGDELDLIKFLHWASTSQRVGLWYTGMDTTHPHVRIQTALDQLDALVTAGDVSIPPIVGHVGIMFQLGVVDSDDLPAEMDKKYSLLELGWRYVRALGDHKRMAHVENMMSNYAVLKDTAKNGHMKIFKRLYIALQNATDKKYKDKQDPENNLMHNLDKLTELGQFSAMGMATLHAMETKGALEDIVAGVMNLTTQIRKEDFPQVRSLVQLLTQKPSQRGKLPAGADDRSLLDYTIDAVLAQARDGHKKELMKDVAFHLLPTLRKFDVDLGVLLSALEEVAKRPEPFKALVDLTMADIVKEDSTLLTFGANGYDLNQDQVDAINDTLDIVTGLELVGSSAALSEGYKQSPQPYSDLHRNFAALCEDPKFKAMEPVDVIKKIAYTYRGQKGILDSVSDVLSHPADRENLRVLTLAMTQKRDLSALVRHFFVLVENGDVDQALHFIFDNLHH